MGVKLDRIDSRISRLEDESRAVWRSIGHKLDILLRASQHEMCDVEATPSEVVMVQSNDLSSAPVSATPTAGAVLDRKRLKERLKDAAAEPNDARSATTGLGCTALAERVFGIRAADARAGKERSRCPHLRSCAPRLYADGVRALRRPAAGWCIPARPFASVRRPRVAPPARRGDPAQLPVPHAQASLSTYS